MPYKDPDRNRAYQREWARKNRAAFMAGKTCLDCGTDEQIELHHLDPSKKESHKIWSWSPARRREELAKCVVLCRPCHMLRHYGTEMGHNVAGYRRGCRCDVCRKAQRDRQRRYRAAKTESARQI